MNKQMVPRMPYVQGLTPVKAAGEGGSDPSSELPLTYPREALRIQQPVA